MSEQPLRVALLIGSTRHGRFGSVVANWFADQASSRRDMTLDVIDLVDVELPSAYPGQRSPEINAYVERIGLADAFVVVTPEYNHGYPAALKQAIDIPHVEWKAKPAGFVSYGGLAGGLRAVEQLRQVFAELHVVTMRDTVSFHNAHAAFDPSGRPRAAEGPTLAAATMLDQLAWWATALRVARAGDPARKEAATTDDSAAVAGARSSATEEPTGQGSSMGPFSARELSYLCGERRLARLATVGKDGMPHVAPVGWTYRSEEAVIEIGGRGAFDRTKKYRDVQHTGRAAIVVDDVLPPWQPRGVEVRGRAEAVAGPPSIIRLHPDRVISWGLDAEG